MAKFTTLIQERFLKRKEKKLEAVASAASVFPNNFRMNEIGEKERSELAQILQKYTLQEGQVDDDLRALIGITEQVRAITNQAAMLHGERIKQAQTLLKRYKDGAFTCWLKATYGNRQTPYNFLQYFEFYSKTPETLHKQIEAMPRQAVYTLASRSGEQAKKEEIVRGYNGETKQEMISRIRAEFPLKESDKRREDIAEGVIKALNRLTEKLSSTPLTQSQSKLISKQLTTLKGLLK